MWVLIALLVAAGPLLGGAVDLWAQTLLLACVVVGTALWLGGRIAAGQVPAPRGRFLVWAGVLGFLGWLAARTGPLPAYALPDLWWRLGGLWMFVTLAAVPEEERDRVDASIHAAAWAMVAVIFWESFMAGQGGAWGGLLKDYLFGGACLFFLPLAARRRDYLLLAALAAGMFWSRSGGAWVALALALLVRRPGLGTSRILTGSLAAACAVALMVKFRDPAVQDRWMWWNAAWRMFLKRPWTGWGPGSFTRLLPSFTGGGGTGGLAHQSILESLAETGLPHTLLFFGGAGFLLLAGCTHRTFGAMAVFIQSLWDPTLSIPANFWLFSYGAGSSVRPGSRLIEVPPRWRLPAVVVVFGAAAVLSAGLWKVWRADQLRQRARVLLAGEAEAGGALNARVLLERSLGLADHPETRVLLAEADLRGGGASPGETMAAAAGQLERAVELDPFRPATWRSLESLYRGLGMSAAAAHARRRGAALRPAGGAGD